MPPACGSRGRTDSRVDSTWRVVRTTGPAYPNAKTTLANPQLGTGGIVQLDGVMLGAPIDCAGRAQTPYAYAGFPPRQGARMTSPRKGRGFHPAP